MSGKVTNGEGVHASDVVKSCFAAWARGDVEGTLHHIDDDCVYTIHVPADVLSFGGVHEGKDAIANCFQDIREQFAFVQYALENVREDGDIVRAQIVFSFTHRSSGEYFDGRCRHVTQVKGKKVVRIDEYHDVDMTRAFVEMVRRPRG